MTVTLDQVIRDAARRGDILHLTFGPTGDGEKWQANFKSTDKDSAGYAVHIADDPIEAIIGAIKGPKWLPRRVKTERRLEDPKVDDIL
jgi:hypothetical protein